MFWFFGYQACGNLVPQAGIEPVPAAMEGKVLTTGLSGKSWFSLYKDTSHTGLGACSPPVWASQVTLVAKNPPANTGDVRDVGSIPGSGRSLGGGHIYPLQ